MAGSATQTLYDWSLVNIDLAMWGLHLLQTAPILTAWRVRYNWWPPALLGEASPYVHCVKGMSAREFWLGHTLFPYQCSIQAISESGKRWGPEWTGQYLKAHMQIQHVELLVQSLSAASKRRILDGVAGPWATEKHIVKTAAGVLFFNLVGTIFGGVLYYLTVYFLNYVFFFIPSAFVRFFFKYITIYLGPLVLTVAAAVQSAKAWTEFSTLTHRVIFLLFWLLLFANYSAGTDYTAPYGGFLVSIPTLVWCCFLLDKHTVNARATYMQPVALILGLPGVLLLSPFGAAKEE